MSGFGGDFKAEILQLQFFNESNKTCRSTHFKLIFQTAILLLSFYLFLQHTNFSINVSTGEFTTILIPDVSQDCF